jgi:hypothetical protein
MGSARRGYQAGMKKGRDERDVDDEQLILRLRDDEKKARPARELEEEAPVDIEEIPSEEREVL